MRRTKWLLAVLCVGVMGCGSSSSSSDPSTSGTIDTRYVAATELAGAVPVGTARQSVETDQSVTVVGTIGGSTEPFVEGMAAFTIVDASVPYCQPEEGCPTPWDYCCTQDQVKDNIATVKVVDESGRPVTVDARELLGVKELSVVVVRGQAERDDHGNLTVAASKVFVRPSE